jgi:hypothetical protein
MVYVITTAMEGILRATGVRKNLHPLHDPQRPGLGRRGRIAGRHGRDVRRHR